ncbi:MAG: hypothetical protein ICV63_05390 [Coleofasciculus sp. Co-bin14]|nr:hypothetical protein [Coleofasciculus sp. Co-bin14]
MERSYSYKVRTDLIPTTEQDKRAFAERILQRQPALLELPLILVPEHLLHVPEEFRQQEAVVISALNRWMTRAKEEDFRLNIERPWIPTAEIYIPNNLKGKRFFKIAKAIGKIPSLNIVPKNQNQAYWLLTMRYFWQARGVLFAHKLLGVIPNPIEEQGVLFRYLPSTSIKNLELITDIDLACFLLLVRGGRYIREWAAKKKIRYPFKSPMDLFLEIEKQSFLMVWQLGPDDSELDWLSNAQQRDNISARIRLLEKNPWLAPTGKRKPYPKAERAYLKFLRRVGWYGYWLLALRDHFDEEQFEEKLLSGHWQDYINALRAGKELYVSEFNWRGGQPYKTRATNKVQRVEGFIDSLNYIQWRWL